MAGIAAPSPFDALKRVLPRTGPPVQNQGGFALNTAPANPVQQAAVRQGPPGPTPRPDQMVPAFRPTTPVAAPGIAKTPSWPAPTGPTTAPAAGGMSIPEFQKPSPTGPTTGPGVAPVAPAAGPGATPGAFYGPGGGTTAPPGSLEGQLRDYISGAMKGSVSQDFINRAKQDVFRTVQGQERQGVNQINADAISRGLFKSGIPAESVANLQGASQSAMAKGVADILNNAENTNIQGRQAAAGTAGSLLSENRTYDQYLQQRADAEAARARAAAAANRTFTYIDPDTGQAYQLPENMF